MKCPKCETEFTATTKFCSRRCANSRVFTKASKKKKSDALKGKPKSYKLTDEQQQRRVATFRKTYKRKFDETPFEKLGIDGRRRRVREEQDGKCNRCGLNNWLGEFLILEVEHKDGNQKNNERSNVEGLCPNCHSLTLTWRGRNNKNRPKITDESLLAAVDSSSSISEALRTLGLADKGKNYERVRRLLVSQ
jgi:hypothetical protein